MFFLNETKDYRLRNESRKKPLACKTVSLPEGPGSAGLTAPGGGSASSSIPGESEGRLLVLPRMWVDLPPRHQGQGFGERRQITDGVWKGEGVSGDRGWEQAGRVN